MVVQFRAGGRVLAAGIAGSQAFPCLVAGRSDVGTLLLKPNELGIDARQVVGGCREAASLETIAENSPSLGSGRLAKHCFQSCGHLAHDVGQPLAVLFCPLKPPESFGPAGAKLGDPGRFFKDASALLAARHEQLIDTSLLNDAVGLGGGAGAREEFADVAEATDLAVDQILALTAAVDAAADPHLIGGKRELAGGVVEGEGGFCGVERPAAGSSRENHVGHLFAAEAADRLFAEHPLDRIDDVGFARAVGPHDGRHARVKLEPRAVSKAFEAVEFEGLEPRHDSTSLPVEPVAEIGTPASTSASISSSMSCDETSS